MNKSSDLYDMSNFGNVSMNINEYFDLLGDSLPMILVTDRETLKTGLYGWWQHPLREIHVTKECKPGEIKFDGKPVSVMPPVEAVSKPRTPIEKQITRLK